MSLPKEPRQLMINLMYLVLTALLAMNVSSEILNAFKIIGKSITNSNKTADERNKGVTELFTKFAEDPKANVEKKQKVADALKLAEEVNAKTNAIIAEIQGYRKDIIDVSGGYTKDGELKQIEFLDGGTIVMIEKGNGPKLLASLKKYKDEIAGLVPVDGTKMVAAGVGNNKAIFDQLPLNFDTEKSDNNPDGDWTYGNFHMSPTIANITLLDKYINDVRSAQSVALDNIWQLATGEKHRNFTITPQVFNEYAIILSADNSFVLPGEQYHARVMMGTYNKTLKNLTFNVNGRTIVPTNGVADFTEIANTVGGKNINVTATFTDTLYDKEGGKTLQTRTVKIDKPVQYFVGEAQASISLDKMNVFYIGVPNPITLSASGIPADKLVATGEGVTLTKVAGVNKYEVFADKPGKAKITLSGTRADGKTMTFGTYEYRVKVIPPPYPIVAGKRGGKAGVAEMQAQIAMFAKLDGFDFDAKFRIVSFDIFHQPRRKEAQEASSKNEYLTGPNASADIKTIMESLGIGSKLYFDNIKAVGPDKRIQNIGSLAFTLSY